MDDESLHANAERGYIYVGVVREREIWKKKTEPGGWAYYIDEGWEGHTPIIFDSTLWGVEELEVIVNDLKRE